MNTKLDLDVYTIAYISGLHSDECPNLCMDIQDIKTLIPKLQKGAEYHKADLFYFLLALIELDLHEDAIKTVEQLIILDSPQWAACLAEDLYDVFCPLSNDDLWVKYMKIAGAGGYTSFEVLSGSNVHSNNCGLWIPGHTEPEFYIENLFLELEGFDFDKTKLSSLVQHTYLVKNGSEFNLAKDSSPTALPITTVINEDFDDALSKLFSDC